ncbi:MAG: hypothetical protein ACRD29_22640 [Acidimicrobiales bacterium]
MGSNVEALPELAARARPVTLAGERVLPVLPAFEGLLPGGQGGLRRGSTVAVAGAAGSTSLALALLAGASAAGSWAALAGLPSVGLPAAAGFGVALERVVLVGAPPANAWATVVATLVDAFDLVLARAGLRVRAGDARRLAARARERGSVLIVLADASAAHQWPALGCDLRFTVVATAWEGLADGHGHLQARRVTVEVGGRRGADRSRRVDLWLPAADGGVAAVERLAPVRRLGAAS